MSKNRLIYTVLLTICLIVFWWFENFYSPGFPSDEHSNAPSLPFNEQLLPKSTTGSFVRHMHYMLSYSEDHEQAEWVAYTLSPLHLTYDDRKRPYFIEDPKVRTKSADWRNYKGSGYDRGHLCPAGDRRFSEFAYNETFYTSNISPQNKEFNAGVWNRLEMKVRQWCKKYNTLHIITGGVLTDGLKEIGDEAVDVPDYFYKIVVREKKGVFTSIAFLLPHRESNRPLADFVVTVDDVEKMTGIDFFEAMPLVEEEVLEKQITTSNWTF